MKERLTQLIPAVRQEIQGGRAASLSDRGDRLHLRVQQRAPDVGSVGAGGVCR